MRTHVFRKLEESSSSPVFFTADDVNTSIDEGYEEISDMTEWNESNTTLNLQAVTYYDLRNAVSENVLSVRRIFNTQTNKWLVPTTVKSLDAGMQRWETVEGEPREFFMRGLFILGLFPRPASAAGTIKVYFTSMPTPFAADTDEPGFPQEFHWGLVEYAVYDLLSQDSETEKALAHWNNYLGYESGLKAYVDSRLSLDRTGVLG